MSRITRKEREKFFVDAGRYGYRHESIEKMLRNVATIFRLNEAECNGDWPCDNGERKVQPCAECGAGYVKSTLLKGGRCPSCRAAERVKILAAEVPGIVCQIHGDPRGWTLTLKREGDQYGIGI